MTYCSLMWGLLLFVVTSSFLSFFFFFLVIKLALFFYFNLFYCWLRWAFIAVYGLSLVKAIPGYLPLAVRVFLDCRASLVVGAGAQGMQGLSSHSM